MADVNLHNLQELTLTQVTNDTIAVVDNGTVTGKIKLSEIVKFVDTNSANKLKQVVGSQYVDNIAANTIPTYNITFPTGTFADVPNVSVSFTGPTSVPHQRQCFATSITKDGFTIQVSNQYPSGTFTTYVRYVAIGK